MKDIISSPSAASFAVRQNLGRREKIKVSKIRFYRRRSAAILHGKIA